MQTLFDVPEHTDQPAFVTLERGRIQFFFRPRVGQFRPRGLRDLQRFYVVLSASGRNCHRLALIGRKRLPDPGEPGHARYWGFVNMVCRTPSRIRRELAGQTYATKTRGLRHLPAARLAGEGIYRIARHGSHTHLAYELTRPNKLGSVQEDLRIVPQASYIIAIFNPDAPPAEGTDVPSVGQSVELPRRLRERFRGRRFAEADPPSFLDHEGTEFVLIAASERGPAEADVRPRPDDVAALRDLHLDESEDAEPELVGEWD